MKKITMYLLVVALVSSAGCATISSFTNLLNCQFRMQSLTDTNLAGISVQNVRSFSDLSIMQAGSVARAYLSGNLPLSFNLNVQAKNPNNTQAILSNFDWIASVDDVEIARGTHSERVVIPGNDGLAVVPLNIQLNLLEVFSGKSREALTNLVFNLAEASGEPSRVSLQLKPTVYVNGDIPISYPGYISVGTEFGGSQQ
jgi:LEA14-like dessication related protein